MVQHSSLRTHESALRLRFGGYSPPESIYSRAALRLKELIEEQSNGRIAVDIFWNVLDFRYGAEQLIQMVESGLLGGCYMSTSYLAQRAPRLAVLDLPFLITSRAQAFSLLDGSLGAAMASELEAATGLKHLGYWENGFRHLSNARRPVRSPDDLAGLRIRLQPNDLHQRAFRLLGAEPVLTDVADLVAALRDGRVDGQENPLDNIWTYGVYRYTRYVTLSQHLFGVRGLYLNQAWYEGLDRKLRTVVAEAALKATAEQRALAAHREAELRSKLEQHGLEFIELSPQQVQAFRLLVEPLHAEAAETLGADFLAQFSAA
jgi:tripartite ATP-independent transporter DctP family solute receptor